MKTLLAIWPSLGQKEYYPPGKNAHHTKSGPGRKHSQGKKKVGKK